MKLRFAIAVAISALVPLGVSQIAPGTWAKKEDVFAWFDQFGYTAKMNGALYIRESWVTKPNGTRELQWRSYLTRIPSKGKSFKLFDLRNQNEEDFDLRGVKRIGILAALKNELQTNQPGFKRPANWNLQSGGAEDLFIWSRLAALHQQNGLSEQFYSLAIKSERNFQASLIYGFGYPLTWRTAKDLATEKISREEYRRRLEARIIQFPGLRQTDEMKVYVRLLKAHANDPPRKDPVGKLIDKLMDEPQLDRNDYKPKPISTAIEKLGLKAVPELIAALEDERLTRTVIYREGGDDTANHLHRVGDLAWMKLYNATGLVGEWSWGTDETWGERQVRLKSHIVAWWNDVQTRGYLAVQRDIAQSGDSYSDPALRKFAHEFPSEFVNVARDIIGNPKAETKRVALELLGNSKNPKARDVIAEAAQSSDSSVREQALELLAKGNPQSEANLIWDRWRKMSFHPTADQGEADLMASFGRADMVAAVRQRFFDLNWTSRRSLATRGDDSVNSIGYENGEPIKRNKKVPSFPAYAAEWERLLVDALADKRGSYGGGYGTFNPAQPEEYRTSEYAAYSLHRLWPQRYADLSTARLLTADIHERKMENSFRRRNRLPLLPEISRPTPSSLDRARLQEALKRGEFVESFGLAALPLLRVEAKKNPKLVPLADRIAWICRRVYVYGKWVKPELATRAGSVKGRILTCDVVLELLDAIENSADPSAPGYALMIVRDRYGDGCTLSLEMSGAPATGNSSVAKEIVGVESETLSNRETPYQGKRFSDDVVRQKWRGWLEKCFRAPVNTHVSISIECYRKD